MSTPSLAEQLLSQLQGAPVQQIAQQLGTTPNQTSGAISAALPLLLGALGRNAAQPSGAEALMGALQKDHSGNAASGNLTSTLLSSALSGGGAAILGHMFGNKQSRAADGLGQATGLNGAQAGQLLAILAPIVMSFLANRSSQQGMDAGALGQMLGQNAQQSTAQGGVAGGLLTAVLDQDGDGQLGIGDLLKLGGSLLGGGNKR